MPELTAAVFDTVIYFQAAIQEYGPAAALLRLAAADALVLYTCEEQLEELHDVLTRPAIQRKYHLTEEDSHRFSDRVRKIALVAPPPPPPRFFAPRP